MCGGKQDKKQNVWMNNKHNMHMFVFHITYKIDKKEFHTIYRASFIFLCRGWTMSYNKAPLMITDSDLNSWPSGWQQKEIFF